MSLRSCSLVVRGLSLFNASARVSYYRSRIAEAGRSPRRSPIADESAVSALARKSTDQTFLSSTTQPGGGGIQMGRPSRMVFGSISIPELLGTVVGIALTRTHVGAVCFGNSPQLPRVATFLVIEATLRHQSAQTMLSNRLRCSKI